MLRTLPSVPTTVAAAAAVAAASALAGGAADAAAAAAAAVTDPYWVLLPNHATMIRLYTVQEISNSCVLQPPQFVVG